MDIEIIYDTYMSWIPWSKKNQQYASPTQFLYLIPAGIVMCSVRLFLTAHLFKPFGLYLGLKPDRPKKIPDNPLLDQFYNQAKAWSHDQILAISKEANLTPREVESWLRIREGYSKPTALFKFCESLWRLLFSIFICSFCIITCWNEPWFWDINECWNEVGNNAVTDDIWWYGYLIMAYYTSLCISQFIDTKRKDFWAMLVHHIVCIIFGSLSWIFGFHRILVLMALLHDFSHIFLHAMICALHLKYHKITIVAVIVFVIVWFITRLGLFPFWIMPQCLEDSAGILTKFSIYYVLNGFTFVILCFNLFWTYLIVKFIISLRTGKFTKDLSGDSCEEILKED